MPKNRLFQAFQSASRRTFAFLPFTLPVASRWEVTCRFTATQIENSLMFILLMGSKKNQVFTIIFILNLISDGVYDAVNHTCFLITKDLTLIFYSFLCLKPHSFSYNERPDPFLFSQLSFASHKRDERRISVRAWTSPINRSAASDWCSGGCANKQ